jgi:hypothetical protein
MSTSDKEVEEYENTIRTAGLLSVLIAFPLFIVLVGIPFILVTIMAISYSILFLNPVNVTPLGYLFGYVAGTAVLAIYLNLLLNVNSNNSKSWFPPIIAASFLNSGLKIAPLLFVQLHSFTYAQKLSSLLNTLDNLFLGFVMFSPFLAIIVAVREVYHDSNVLEEEVYQENVIPVQEIFSRSVRWFHLRNKYTLDKIYYLGVMILIGSLTYLTEFYLSSILNWGTVILILVIWIVSIVVYNRKAIFGD